LHDGSAQYAALGNDVFCGVHVSPSTQSRLYMFTDKGEFTGSYPNYYIDSALHGNISSYFSLNSTQLTINDNLLYKDGLCDTAFYLDKENLQRQPAYYFSFGKYRNAVEYLKSLRSIPGNWTPDKGVLNHIVVAGFIEIGDYVLFTCNFCIYMPESEKIERNIPIPEGVNSLGSLNPVRSIFNKKTSELFFLKKSEDFEDW